jgi:hypothetical protein
MLNRKRLAAIGAVFAIGIGAAAPAAAQSHIGESRAIGSASGSITDRTPLVTRGVTGTRLRPSDGLLGRRPAADAAQNDLAVIGEWARSQGVTCTVDEAMAVGVSDDNNDVYEVGCAGAEGYWLEKVGAGWKLQDCLQVASVGETCRFTTAQEQAESFKGKLAGTEAAACDVAQVRLIGQNANGRFYEAKCAAEGQGYIARLNNDGVTQQVYLCANAQRIAGGCTLTAATAAAPAAE